MDGVIQIAKKHRERLISTSKRQTFRKSSAFYFNLFRIVDARDHFKETANFFMLASAINDIRGHSLKVFINDPDDLETVQKWVDSLPTFSDEINKFIEENKS